jgi:glycosyltransferase involved in cell wall biosynthesis
MLTRNEEDRLPASLEPLRGHVERVLVLDAESDDRTREIAEELGAEVSVRGWEGYVNARRHILAAAATPWVLMIDADEVLDAAFWEEIERRGFPDVTADAFQVRRRTVYLGRTLRFAGQPDWKTLLFRREKAFFEDRAVHEAVQIDGRVERLRSEILHYSYRSPEEHYERMLRYERLAAADLHERGKRATAYDLWFRPFWRWFTQMFVRGAILDGKPGRMIARSTAASVRLRYMLLRDLERGVGGES